MIFEFFQTPHILFSIQKLMFSQSLESGCINKKTQKLLLKICIFQKKSYNFCQSYNTQMYNSYINICSTHTCTINFKSE